MGKIFSEFFTNLAVAWMTAGIIAPLFTPEIFSIRFFVTAMSAGGFSLLSAILTKDIK